MVPEEVVKALRDAASRSSVDDFWTFWSRNADWVYFGLMPRLEYALWLVALPFFEEVCYGFVAGVWEAELLAAWVPVGCVGLARVMWLMCNVLSILLVLPLLLSYSFAGVLNL